MSFQLSYLFKGVLDKTDIIGNSLDRFFPWFYKFFIVVTSVCHEFNTFLFLCPTMTTSLWGYNWPPEVLAMNQELAVAKKKKNSVIAS